MITKNAPLSSGANNFFGAKLNKKIVKERTTAKKEIIIFFLLTQFVKDKLYTFEIFFKKLLNLITTPDFFHIFFKNLLPSIGLSESATNLILLRQKLELLQFE